MSEEHCKNFELCVRGIIQQNEKVLVCGDKRKNYYFFPGGHVNFAEKSKEALDRELKEELDISVKDFSFIGMVENVFTDEGEKHHEINLVFSGEAEEAKDKSKEDHIDFLFFDTERLSEENVLPIALRDSVVKWLKDGKIFWASQI